MSNQPRDLSDSILNLIIRPIYISDIYFLRRRCVLPRSQPNSSYEQSVSLLLKLDAQKQLNSKPTPPTNLNIHLSDPIKRVKPMSGFTFNG